MPVPACDIVPVCGPDSYKSVLIGGTGGDPIPRDHHVLPSLPGWPCLLA